MQRKPPVGQPSHHKKIIPKRSQSSEAKPGEPNKHLFEGGSLDASFLNKLQPGIEPQHHGQQTDTQGVEPQHHGQQTDTQGIEPQHHRKKTQDLSQPMHHRDLPQNVGQPQVASAQQKDPFRRFQPNLDLSDKFLGLPKVAVRLLITKALRESHYSKPYYMALAYKFDVPTTGYSSKQSTEIELNKWALMNKHKDEIIAACNNPKFSPAQVAKLIAKRTGILLDVHADPKETIRIILNGLHLFQQILNKIPENPDPSLDRQDIINFFEINNIFSQTNVKFHEHLYQMRDYVFKQYENDPDHPHPIIQKPDQVRSESGVMITQYEPNLEGNLDPKERLARELVAYNYTYNVPPSDSKYMSANAFREYLHIGNRKYLSSPNIESQNPQDIACNQFIQEAIDQGLLDRYISDCNDKDTTEKIVKAEFEAYFFNGYRERKPETQTTRAFRQYIFDEHPNSKEYEVDQILKQMIKSKDLPPYEPKYDAQTDKSKILLEEAIAYRLNVSKNREKDLERIELEDHLNYRRAFLFRSTPSIDITDDELTDFLDQYFKNYKP